MLSQQFNPQFCSKIYKNSVLSAGSCATCHQLQIRQKN